MQQRLLEAEGVVFNDEHELDMMRYQYHPEGEIHQISLLGSDDTLL